jgi:hypothetical protein
MYGDNSSQLGLNPASFQTLRVLFAGVAGVSALSAVAMR